MEPETEPRPPLIMLVLNPDIVDASSMELSAMETAHTTCFDSIRLRFMKMSGNHSTSEHVRTRYLSETPMVELTVILESHIGLQVPCE
jgi:hypothetical protein